MKYKKSLFVMVCMLGGILQTMKAEHTELSSDLEVAVQAHKVKKVSLGLVVLGEPNKALEMCAARLKKDLEWSNQANVTMQSVTTLKHEKDLRGLFDEHTSVVIILSKQDDYYTWRLYDIAVMQMVAGMKIQQAAMPISMVAHTIADQLWPQLFGQKSSFCSKIAFSKQIWRCKYGKEKPYKQIWICDFDGSNQQLFVDNPTTSFASRWNNDVKAPLLFYSENTLSNVQLVMSNMFGKRRVICSFDGLNMQPTFSDDDKKVVFCLSKDGTSQLYYAGIDNMHKHQKIQRLTFNTGNNIAPCFVGKTHVAFVSDFKTNKPQIFMLDLATKVIEQITDGGYCACPSYSPIRHQLVYSKMMGKAMQLFVYDLKTKQHIQLTDDRGSKEEGSWSACGNYIVFGVNDGWKSRIAQYHLPTKTMRYLTDEKDHCTYPDCSPLYQNMLGILVR